MWCGDLKRLRSGHGLHGRQESGHVYRIAGFRTTRGKAICRRNVVHLIMWLV